MYGSAVYVLWAALRVVIKAGGCRVDSRKSMRTRPIDGCLPASQLERYERTISLLKQALAASLPLLDGDVGAHEPGDYLAARQKAMRMLRDADHLVGRVSGRP